METLAKSPITKKSEPKGKIVSEEKNETEDVVIDLGFELDPHKTYIFEVLKKSDALRIENLGSRCKIYDPKEKRYKELRYIPVAPTIFYEDQHESYDTYPDEPLMFNRNVLFAKGSDRRLMEYLMIHDLNEASPFRISNKPAMFKLMDKDAEDAIKAQRHAKEMEACSAIRDMSIDDLKPIARIVFGITETTETAIRNTMYDLAKKDKKGMERSNAEKIIENLVNPKLQRQYYIQSALDSGTLVANPDKMQVRFSEGDVFACNLNRAINPKAILNEITDFSFTPEGAKFYTLLRSKI